MKLFNLLDSTQLKAAYEVIDHCDWSDGKDTALGQAKEIKQNLQIRPDVSEIQPVFSDIKRLLFHSPEINAYANIHSFAGLRVALYKNGGHYGWHVDMAHMESKRTDLSFTIFLNDESEYEGGDLQMDYGSHRVNVRGKKGQVVVYPTGVLHQVTPVTKGERLCIVGWIESLVPLEEDRQAIFNLTTQIAYARQEGLSQPVIDQLNYTLQYLKRRVSQ